MPSDPMNPESTPKQFRIYGMDCAEEVAVLKREVGPVVGGESHISFDVLGGRMAVDPASGASSEAIVQAVGRTGMRAAPWREDEEFEDRGRFWQQYGRATLTSASGLFGLLGFLVHSVQQGLAAAIGAEVAATGHGVSVVSRILYGIGIAAGVWYFLPKAWYAVRRLRPDMNLLMTVAVAGAVLIGEWFEAAAVAFLFSLSLLLESWSVSRARRAVAALMELSPETVRIRSDGGAEIEIPAADAVVGTHFIVKPGERFALDGRVVDGTSHVNQAPITGESEPVEKSSGAEVFAGTINGDGALVVESTKPAGATTLANIIRMVGEAHSRRSPSEQWVEKFARIYTPAVMVLALAILLVPPVLFGQPWSYWIYNSLVLLVIACPCALVISTPVSVVAAIAAAARHGVLIKGGVFVELPSRLKAIAFDKTGTLTTGRPTVAEVAALGGHTQREVIERAAAMEARSDHPLAHAILEYAAEQQVTVTPAQDFQILPGKGATARVDGRNFWLGSHRYLEERGQETDEVHRRLEELSSAGRSVVVLGDDRHVWGMIALADQVRPHVRETLDELRRAGVERLIMLTGDNRATARAIADQAGIDEVRSELLPEQKVAAIEELVDRWPAVAMVGDGVNDAPALARASIGVAMGAAGSDAALETADIALMSDDLSRLPWLIRHSRRALSIIRQNIVFALAVKAVFVGLTLAGAASLWAAISADMGASLLVIFNGLRLLRG